MNQTDNNNWLLGLAALVVIIAGVKASTTIIIPFLLAIFIAILCAPPIAWLRNKRVPAPLAVLIVVTTIIGFGIILTMGAGSSLREFTAALPHYQLRVQQELGGIIAFAQSFGIEINAQLFEEYLDPSAAMKLVTNLLAGLSNVLTDAFLIILTVIFILLEASSLPDKIKLAFLNPENTMGHFAHFTESVNRYLAIKTTVSIATGLLVFALLTTLKIDYPILWAMVALLLNFVPNIGSIIAAFPAVLMAFIQYGIPDAAIVAAAYASINVIMGNFIEPRFMGKGLGLSTLVVFVSLVFWGWMLGPVGMLLSVPLTIIVKIALENSPQNRWIAIMLGSDSAAQATAQINTDVATPAPTETAEQQNTNITTQ